MAVNTRHEFISLLKQANVAYRFALPSKQLKPYINFYIFGKINTKPFRNHLVRVISCGNISLVIQYEGYVINYAKGLDKPYNQNSFFTGLSQLTEPKYACFPENLKAVLISFKPGGFRQIFKYDAQDIKSEILDADLILGNEINNLREQLFTAVLNSDRYLLIENFLKKQLDKNKRLIIRSREIAQNIIRENGNVRISKLCNTFTTSKKNMERMFHREIGIGPKQYACIIRFNHLCYNLMKSEFPNTDDDIFNLGYYDQSHFDNEFKNTTGYTYSEFIKLKPAVSKFTDRLFILSKISAPASTIL